MFVLLLALAACQTPVLDAQPRVDTNAKPNGPRLTLPLEKGSVRFAVVGDTGTGDRYQRETAAQMVRYRAVFPFDFAIMMGDNIYGGDDASALRRKFEEPYKALIDGGVQFYACLGNHDQPIQRQYKLFNMNEELFHTFKKGNVRFFALDSNYMDKKQLDWLEKELSLSGSDWKIPYFHHPLYSSGARHGSELDLRAILEPLFIKHGVDVVMSGHEHFYERIKPQQGIYYFIVGGTSKLRKGDIRPRDWTLKGFDTDRSFMLAEVAGDVMHFQTISRTGETVDSGALKRKEKRETTNAKPR